MGGEGKGAGGGVWDEGPDGARDTLWPRGGRKVAAAGVDVGRTPHQVVQVGPPSLKVRAVCQGVHFMNGRPLR